MVVVSKLDASEMHLKGEMVSPHDPEVFWKVFDGTGIYCVCTSEDHASAIAGALSQHKIAKSLSQIRADLDQELGKQLIRTGVVVARCAHVRILRIALNAWDQLQPEYSGKSI